MPVMLLPIIYLTFVSLGLPDSALGAAWPSMFGPLGAQVSWQGALAAITCVGTIASSLASVRVVRRFGTGPTCAVSTALTALALVGYSTCTEFWQLCLWAVPYGLGAGAIDAALNSYVATHYAARHMSWLHCMWGMGASVGPMVMGWRLTEGTWQSGWMALAAIQAAITAFLFASMDRWAKGTQPAGEKGDGSAEATAPRPLTRRELLRVPGVRQLLVCFFCYSALESTCGSWAASWLTLARGIDGAVAAGWAGLVFVGVTAGRAASGFLTMRMSDRQLIRMGQLLIAAGATLLALPLPDWAAVVGLVTLGVGCAPIYPSIIHCAPLYFGAESALAITGMQMAVAYTGSLLMSPLFGLVAQYVTPAAYPFYLLALLACMVVMSEGVNRRVAVQ